MSSPRPARRLSVEELEGRDVPSFGTPWLDGSSLTLSFVPDGADISGRASNLFALLGSTTAQPQWQREILRAYQTWAVEANLNVGLVADGGQAMGVAGAPQEDVRFGDIRVGARPLAAQGVTGSAMAAAAGFDYNSKTWAGDLVFNSAYRFGVGGTPGQQSDIFSVALHEAGHSFGLPDQNTDPTSVMWARYQGVLSGLAPADVAALRALYGARADDGYEGASGNGTLATAYALGNLTALSADVTRAGDADVYKLVTPAAPWTTGLTVALKASGISLLTARVTILDAQGNVVAGAVTTNPLGNDLSVSIPNYQPSTTYFVKVEGATSDVFSVGSYVLKLNYAGYGPGGPDASATSAFNTNSESWAANDTPAAAMTLSPVRANKANTFTLSGSIAGPSDVDWYRITPTLPGVATGTLFLGTMTTTNGLLPTVAVYSAQGQLLPAVVTMNEGGAYEIQLANASGGATYFVRVAAADPAGPRSTGAYTLGATLAPVAPTAFQTAAGDTLSSADAVHYGQMQVTGDRLSQFALSASGGSTTAATAVRVTVFDAAGRAVFTLAVAAGRPVATGAVWLASGTYTVVFNAATQDGSAFQGLSASLSARKLTDPIDPYPVDPFAPPPPPQVPITVSPPAPTPPPPPIVDPISNPFAGLFAP